MNKQEPKYRDVILNRMLIAGESGEPSEETTTLIEHIIRDMMRHVLGVANSLAARRGSTKFTVNDILFQLRHDPARVGRLRDYLAWRKIRSTAAKSDKEAGGDAGDLTLDDPEDDDLLPDDLDDSPSSDNRKRKTHGEAADMPVIHLPWSVTSFFPHASDILRDTDFDLLDEEHRRRQSPTQSNLNARLARLLKNDERTRGMTPAEYQVWTDARVSSFSHRKKALFREWCGLGVIADHRITEEVPGVLNMLACEWVGALTEEALLVKQQELEIWRAQGRNTNTNANRKVVTDGPFAFGRMTAKGEGLRHKVTNGSDGDMERVMKVPMIEPRHVRTAFERLQAPSKGTRAMNGTRVPGRKKMRLF